MLDSGPLVLGSSHEPHTYPCSRSQIPQIISHPSQKGNPPSKATVPLPWGDRYKCNFPWVVCLWSCTKFSLGMQHSTPGTWPGVLWMEASLFERDCWFCFTSAELLQLFVGGITIYGILAFLKHLGPGQTETTPCLMNIPAVVTSIP